MFKLVGSRTPITGGESGTSARYCDPNWIRAIRDRCLECNVAFFQKQMGTAWAKEQQLKKDTHGADMEFWPADLRIRQFPLNKEIHG